MKHPYLRSCLYNKALKLSNNKFVHNYHELAAEITGLEEKEFKEHVGTNFDNFSDWIKENYDDDLLVSKLKGVREKKKYASIIEKRIKELEKEPKRRMPKAWIITLVLALLLVVEFAYFEYAEYADNEVHRLLMQTVSEGANQNMAYEYRIDELDTQKTALEEKLKAVLAENRILNAEVLVRGPKDRISEQNIRVSGNNVVVYVGEGPVIGEIAGTGSMLPSLTAYSSVIEVIPQKSDEIELGDIIAYKLNEETLIHRVIEISSDEKGWYAIVKGDNSAKPDTEKVRFAQIKRVVVGILY